MQKCGTESLKHWLNQHPDIWMNAPAELNYFANDVQGCDDYTNFQWYLSQFPSDPSETYVGDKSARYLCSKEAAKRIKQFNPDAKILIVLRNPADMIFSLHRHLRKQGLEPERSFKKALAKERFRKKIYGTRFFRHFFYRDVANYPLHLKRFFKEFDKKNIKVIIFEDMKRNPQKIYAEILSFLSLKQFTPSFDILNVANETSRNEILLKLLFILQNLPRPVRGALKFLFSSDIRNSIKTSARIPLADNKKIHLDNLTRNQINSTLLGSIKKLEVLIGRSLNEWYPSESP